MSSKQLIFKEDEIERLRTKMGLLSQDTNHLYLQLKGQASNWNGIPLGNDLQQAQVLLNELTVEAEKLEDVIRGALKGVKGLQEENRRAASQLGQQWNALGGLFGSLGGHGNGNGGRIPIPAFAQKAATNLIHTVASLLGWDELNQDPRVQQLQGIIKQIGIGTVEKIAAQSKLKDIFEARDQIAKAQTAFGVYKVFRNQSQMNVMHKLAEDARAKLKYLGVDAVHYGTGKDLSGHFKQAAIKACDYDPSITSSNVPLVQNESYLLLLRMAMETGVKGDWAQSQLAGKRLEIKLAEAAKIIAEQMAAEKRLNGPPMELPDGTAITPYNMKNETTLNYFRERVSDPKETNQVLEYYVWLEETYGMTEWRKKVVQADAVTRAFAGALIKETVMGVVDTAKLAFNFVVDPEKTTQEMVDKASYLIEHPEVLLEAARTVYNNFDEGTPEQRAAMLGSVASLLVPGLQITKGGKLGKVVDGVQEVVTQTVDKVKDISKGIQHSDALGNLKPFGSIALPGGMGSINVPNDFQNTLHRFDSPEGGRGGVVEGTGNVGKVVPPPKTVISPEMETKILEGQRKIPKNDLIGGHSPSINNANDNFAVEVLSTNADGTKNVVITKQFPDGNISKLKKSTLFPDSWSDEQILKNINDVGNTPTISTRLRDGATWHRATINGVEIDVIKVGDDVTSGYPTGTINASRPSGF